MIDTSKYTNEELQEMFLEQQRQRAKLCFTTSGRLESKIDKKRAILYHGFEKLLNDNINLYKYVKKRNIAQILIIYQIFDLEDDEKYNIKRVETTSYNKQKVLRTYPLMNRDEYRKYVSCSRKEALKILYKKTLQGISALKKYEKRLNFDWQGLNKELKELFARKMNSIIEY